MEKLAFSYPWELQILDEDAKQTIVKRHQKKDNIRANYDIIICVKTEKTTVKFLKNLIKENSMVQSISTTQYSTAGSLYPFSEYSKTSSFRFGGVLK